MKLITKTQALAECSKMWHWLAENPRTDKYDYFAENNIKGDDIPIQGCYACEYRHQSKKRYCCIIPVFDVLAGCLVDTFPYVMWLRTHEPRYALAIAESADVALSTG